MSTPSIFGYFIKADQFNCTSFNLILIHVFLVAHAPRVIVSGHVRVTPPVRTTREFRCAATKIDLRAGAGRLPRTDASTDALHTLQQAFSNANAARPNLFGTHSILSVAQPRIAHARISHDKHGCSAIQDQNGISVNEENTARSYISNLVMTNETEPRTRRFYVEP